MIASNSLLTLCMACELFSSQAPTPDQCDRLCQDLWFKQTHKDLPLLPDEVQAELLTREATRSAERQRKLYLIARARESAVRAEEPCPVRNSARLLESIPGIAEWILKRFPTQLSLSMDLIKLQSKVDIESAVSAYADYNLASIASGKSRKDEKCAFTLYYDTGFELADTLQKSGKPLEAILLRVKTIKSAKQFSQLVDLHESMRIRMQRKELGAGLVDAYLETLSNIQLDMPPSGNTWSIHVWFWVELLHTELATNKERLFKAIQTMFHTNPTTIRQLLRYRVQTHAGTIQEAEFWPSGARNVWKKHFSNLKMTESERSALDQLEQKIFEVNFGDTVIQDRVIMWSRPEGKKLFEKRRELSRSYAELSKSGLWEARLGEFLTEVRAYQPESRTDEERLMTFVEKQNTWKGLLEFSNYKPPLPGEKIDPDKQKEQADTRKPHHAKQIILRDMLGHLESEEGRLVFQLRRSMWIGWVRMINDEIRTAQPELYEFWRESAGATASEIIRAYGR